jgi:GH18 family chitinase
MTYMSRTRSNWNFYKNSGLTVLIAALAGLASCITAYAASASESTHPRLIGYLPGYKGLSYADYAQKIDFSGITHLNLAFGNPPKCDGACTSLSKMDFSIKGQTDSDVMTIVRSAHAAKVKVLLSIGGGGGDQLILPFYNAGLSDQLVGSLDKYLRAHDLDGVDVDIEDPSNMGAPFAKFVSVLVATFHPEGKLVTAAVAKYLQDSMPDSALHQFDFINVMVYSSYAQVVTALDFYSIQKKVPSNQIVLGVPFFGSNTSDTKEEDYQTLLSAYPNAGKVDSIGGGSLDDGQNFNYVGEDTMTKETLLSRKYGGIMIWEMMADAPAPHSLLTVIRKNLFLVEPTQKPCSGTQSTSALN